MMMIPIQVLLTIEKFLAKEKRKKNTSEIYAFVQNGFAITCKQLWNDSASSTRGPFKKANTKNI